MTNKSLKVTHCHGSENYFLLIDGLSTPLDFTESQYQTFCLDAIEQLSYLPIDGILYLLPSQTADARMRIFNKDGTEAEMCGNGFRCIGKKLYLITGKKQFYIETMSGILQGRKEEDIFPGIDSYSVKIPVVEQSDKDTTFYDTEIDELDSCLKFSSLNMGNPHLTASVTHFDIDKLVKTGQKVNNNCRIFPQGNNVSFYKIIDTNTISMMTYERGVGLTNACGTAMAAVSIITAQKNTNLQNQWLQILTPGGMVKCRPEVEAQKAVMLLGNASFIDEYTIEYQPDKRTIKEVKLTRSYPSEQQKYQDYKSEILKGHKF